MAAGVWGTGFYGRIRTLTDSIAFDQQHLDNAPLGPIQRKRLQESINQQRAELRKVRAELREFKLQQKEK